MANVNLREFPDALHRQLKVAAAKRGTSVKWIVIQACKAWLASQK